MTRKEFFKNDLHADNCTVSTPARLCYEIPAPGTTYRLGPYILRCLQSDSETVTGIIERG